MKVFEAVTSAIASENFDRCFAVMGDANQDMLVDLAEKHGVALVHTHHEASAVSIADGYARFSGRPGLASVTQGPGYTNATTSLVCARLHRTPLLLLAGHASLGDPSNPQAAIDQRALARLTTEAVVTMESPKNVDYCLGEAFRAIKGQRGPYVLNMPQDVQQADMPDRHWTYRRMYKEAAAEPPRTDAIEAAITVLAAAKRPAILAGLGAVGARAEKEIRALAEHLAAPVATSLFAAGFCATYPLYLGISGGLGSELTGDVLAESDVLIAFGASLNQWTTHFGQLLKNGKKIIQIDARAAAFGATTPVDVAIEGDAKIAATLLLERLRASEGARTPNAKMTSTLAKAKQKPESPKYEDSSSIDPRRAAQYIEERLPKDERILVFDGGHAAMVCTKALSSPRAENWGLGLDFGAIGQGLGIAIGASFARPGERVTHMTADASFMMNVADFHVAVTHDLPLTVFIFNDNALGQERHDLVHKKLNPKYAEVPQPDFAKLAIGFGAKGFTVRTPDDFGEIDKALSTEKGPVVVDVRINGDVELPISWEIAKHLS
jgi:thiamine pyrophosphate-dependent acetolactate synthase large subunit-like protein